MLIMLQMGDGNILGDFNHPLQSLLARTHPIPCCDFSSFIQFVFCPLEFLQTTLTIQSVREHPC